jgi:hypothetical protein
MRASITALVDELRALIGDQRSPALVELGLLPAVELLPDRSGGLHVTIADDGVGFAPHSKADAPDGHWGVRNARARRVDRRHIRCRQ